MISATARHLGKLISRAGLFLILLSLSNTAASTDSTTATLRTTPLALSIGKSPYFYGVLNLTECLTATTCAIDINPSGGESPNPSNAFGSFVNYSTMSTTTAAAALCTPGSTCVTVPMQGVYRVTVNFDYVNNNPASVTDFIVKVGETATFTVVESPYVAAGAGSPYHIYTGATTLLQGVFFHQTLTNTMILAAGAHIGVWITVGTGDILITGGSIEIIFLPY